jgi:hypothetical protein
MAAERWFYLDASGQRQGPLDLEGLLALIFDGKVPEHVLVWKPGLAGWTKADSVEEIARRIPPRIPSEVAGSSPAVPAPSQARVAPTGRTTGEKTSTTTPANARSVGWILVFIDAVLLLLISTFYPPEAAQKAAEGITKTVIFAGLFAWSFTLGGSRLRPWRFAVIMGGIGGALLGLLLLLLGTTPRRNVGTPEGGGSASSTTKTVPLQDSSSPQESAVALGSSLSSSESGPTPSAERVDFCRRNATGRIADEELSNLKIEGFFALPRVLSVNVRNNTVCILREVFVEVEGSTQEWRLTQSWDDLLRRGETRIFRCDQSPPAGGWDQVRWRIVAAR